MIVLGGLLAGRLTVETEPEGTVMRLWKPGAPIVKPKGVIEERGIVYCNSCQHL